MNCIGVVVVVVVVKFCFVLFQKFVAFCKLFVNIVRYLFSTKMILLSTLNKTRYFRRHLDLAICCWCFFFWFFFHSTVVYIFRTTLNNCAWDWILTIHLIKYWLIIRLITRTGGIMCTKKSPAKKRNEKVNRTNKRRKYPIYKSSNSQFNGFI